MIFEAFDSGAFKNEGAVFGFLSVSPCSSALIWSPEKQRIVYAPECKKNSI